MTTIDPSTGDPLPSDAIQRVLFIASAVHVYNIPPLISTKGYNAATWAANNNARQIFTARLRIIETAVPSADGSGESLSTDVLLEDPTTGQLFAAVPYRDTGAVEAVLDSSRFFAVRVVGDGGRKAILGIGFEERSEAMDFGISLQEVKKVQGIGKENAEIGSRKASGQKLGVQKEPERKDLSLKEGETIHIDLGRKSRRTKTEAYSVSDTGNSLFSIAAPPYVQKDEGVVPFLPPPPSAQDVKAEKGRRRLSRSPEPGSAADLGFDDGEFGEFQ